MIYLLTSSFTGIIIFPMKYDSLRKLNRNQAVKEYRAAHPNLSLKEVGMPFGLSKQRVFAILNDNKKGSERVDNPPLPRVQSQDQAPG